MSKTLGAYFPCYKNKSATDFALKSFRQAFPDSPVLLYSDCGDDFSDLAEKYGCKFVMAENRIGGTGAMSYFSKEKMADCWTRHYEAVKFCGTDYIIALEDDVWVKRGFVINDEFALRGTKHGRLLPQIIDEIVACGGVVPPSGAYGICGGGIYNAAIYSSIYDDVIRDIEENHERLMTPECRQHSAMDCSIVFHFAKRGYKYEFSPWLGEIPRDRGDYAILHGYKEYYQK